MGDSYKIEVSANLINRLTSDWDKPTKKTRKPKPKNIRGTHEARAKLAPTPNARRSNSVPGWPLNAPVFLPMLPQVPAVNGEMEEIRSVVQESQRVLEKLERKEANMLQELNKKARELREKEFKLPYQNPMPCRAEKESCLQCYKDNVEEPLKCAQLVNNFSECARRARRPVS